MIQYFASLSSNSKNNNQNSMSENKYIFQIPISNKGPLNISLKKGESLFVLGANGTGKSTLMHNIFQQNPNHVKRILAHRQIWFTNNSSTMTAF